MSILRLIENNKREYFFWGILVLVFSLASWVAFFHLGNFETSDEEYWKEGRIAEYWDGWEKGLKEGDWSGTYINDKPGVTLALIAGVGLPLAGDLLERYQGIYRIHGEWVYRSYDVSLSKTINIALRIPVTLFSLGMMILSVLLVWKIFGSKFYSLAFAVLLALHPFLLGMSHILNPDTLFWTTGLVSILFFLLLLKTGLWRYVILTSLFFGLAVATKYTANLLLLMYLLAWGFTLVYGNKDIRSKIKNQANQFIFITGTGYALFALLMPATFQEPKLFFEGTIFAPGIGVIIVPLGAFLLAIIVDAYICKGFLFSRVIVAFQYARIGMLRILSGAMLALMIFHLANAWLGAPLVPLDDLKEITRGELGGSQYEGLLSYPYTTGDGTLVSWGKKLLAHSADTLFTLPSVAFIILFFGSLLLTFSGRIRHSNIVALGLAVPWIFFVGGVVAHVFVNARYAIIVQPILLLVSVIFLAEGLRLAGEMWDVVKKHPLRVQVGVIVLGLVSMGIAVGSVYPHLANYQNMFLPKRFSLADSWSYGMYEVAEYLNQKPLAEHLEVWSDRDVFCRFFVGKCLKSGTFDRSFVDPDYIIITRRNVVKGNHFSWKHPKGKIPSQKYYSGQRFEQPEWELDIGGRSANYIKVIALEKEKRSPEESAFWTEQK